MGNLQEPTCGFTQSTLTATGPGMTPSRSPRAPTTRSSSQVALPGEPRRWRSQFAACPGTRRRSGKPEDQRGFRPHQPSSRRAGPGRTRTGQRMTGGPVGKAPGRLEAGRPPWFQDRPWADGAPVTGAAPRYQGHGPRRAGQPADDDGPASGPKAPAPGGSSAITVTRLPPRRFPRPGQPARRGGGRKSVEALRGHHPGRAEPRPASSSLRSSRRRRDPSSIPTGRAARPGNLWDPGPRFASGHSETRSLPERGPGLDVGAKHM